MMLDPVQDCIRDGVISDIRPTIFFILNHRVLLPWRSETICWFEARPLLSVAQYLLSLHNDYFYFSGFINGFLPVFAIRRAIHEAVWLET
jgi:hypothetical protein